MPSYTSSNAAPAEGAATITPSDSTNFTVICRAVYVGSAGNINGVLRDGSVVTFLNVPSGSILPVGFSRINATNTTATNLLALY